MKLIEIGTGYTSIPARVGAATEIVVEELVNAFRRKNIEVQLIDIKTNKRKENDLPIEEVEVPRFLDETDVALGILHKLKRVIYSVALAYKLKNKLKEIKEPVMLHFHNQYNLFFFLKLIKAKDRKNAKISYTVHSYIWGDDWDNIKKTVSKRYFQEILCIKEADYVFVLNDITRDHFISRLGVNEDKIYRVVNGVNTYKYCTLHNELIKDFKEKNGFANRRIVLQVGSVCDRKNQLGILKQIQPFLFEKKEVVYAYAGGIIDVEYFKRINEYASEKNINEQVRYLGEVEPGEQLNLLYNAADVVVFPSKVEAFGLVIIEAISAETPVLLMEKPYFDLERGYSVFENSEQLLRELDEKLTVPSNMSDARDFIVKNYSWDIVAETHLAIWNKT